MCINQRRGAEFRAVSAWAIHVAQGAFRTAGQVRSAQQRHTSRKAADANNDQEGSARQEGAAQTVGVPLLRPYFFFPGGASATAASVVSSRNVNVSWR